MACRAVQGQSERREFSVILNPLSQMTSSARAAQAYAGSWRSRRVSALRLAVALLALSSTSCRGRVATIAGAEPNDNRIAAGELREGVLTLRLEARAGRWSPDGDGGPSLVMPMFAEVGGQPQNPGPLVRVPAGTTIRVSVHNALGDSTLVVYGLATRPSGLADTIHVAPGATRERTFLAGEPGTYFYWGSTTGRPVDTRHGIDSQLHGAFIDRLRRARRSASDRVFVLGSWTGPSTGRGHQPGAARHQRPIVAAHGAPDVHGGRHGSLALGEPDGQPAPDAPARVLLRRHAAAERGPRTPRSRRAACRAW